MNITIRPETISDYAHITGINDAAFKQKNEGLLVETLRQTNEFIPDLSLVAEKNKKLVGHILFYPIKIITKKSSYPSLALAPMSVLPDYQKLGIGSLLVRRGLKQAKSIGFRSVIVLGHAEYYPRFGFQLASRWGIKPPFEVPNNVFFAFELVENELENKSGTVEYPPAFLQV